MQLCTILFGEFSTNSVRESSEVFVHVFRYVFVCLLDKIRNEKAISLQQQYLRNSLALKVDIAAFVCYAMLHCLRSTASLFKGHVKIVCG